ncbi:histidine phosphatase family protein [Vibrio nitrifigilis]|uniref:Histidine phosphatase family protein n=1 Tax=Vibrio nitrifigilis TaxID=2789781 RepID=A0ABS0GJS3_9VIBR|nr:histidine phosphatase family protein [Vibrio nitrifigilis]MBF9002700.1 histidine phosphatase family protein [Vibrio nitrifigilis]
MKITLVRHGKPKASANPKVSAVGFANWVRAYNRSLVLSSSRPSEELYKRINGSYTVSSDLNRAQHSAELCAGRSPDLVLRELREMDIPRLKLPFFISVDHWLILSRICWFLGISGKSESFKVGRRRILSAVDLLVEQTYKNSHITVFGHGLTNRFVAKELKRRGWHIQQKSKGFWGTIELVNITIRTNKHE